MVAGPATPTPAELEALRAYLAKGSVKAAAYHLGRSPQTIANLLGRARRRANVDTTVQLVALLGLRLDR